MAAKIIKEIIIMLLICLVGMLLFAVIFYEYIPNRKVVPEVKEYAASEKVKELIADDVDKEKNQVVLTWNVTASDLNNYEAINEYVPGKSNPFDAVSENPETGATTKPGAKTNTTNTTAPENNNQNSGKTSEGETTSSENNTKTLIDDNGAK